MRKIIITFLFFISVIPLQSSAMEITEIMFDVSGTDGDREWIEVFNNGTESVDLSAWKLRENEVDHTITAVTETEVLVGEYAVIADNTEKFLADNPTYSGLLFKSAFSLSNSGEVLELLDNNLITQDTKEYTGDLGANGDGNSLQYVDGVFIAAAPTPGEENNTVPYANEVEKDTGYFAMAEPNGISAHAEQTPVTEAQHVTPFTITAGRDRMVTTHTPVRFEGTQSGAQMSRKIKYFWNFGDGTTGKGRFAAHTYKYPGVYNVVLNAVSNSHKATARSVVFVAEPQLRVWYEQDKALLHIHNISSQEINIGGYGIKNRYKKAEFVFPRDTIISAGQTLYIDDKTTSFDLEAYQGAVFSTENKKISFPVRSTTTLSGVPVISSAIMHQHIQTPVWKHSENYLAAWQG